MTTNYNNTFKFPIAWHIAYWVINVCLWVLYSLLVDFELIEPLTNKLCYLPSQMIMTYALLYLIIPKLFQGKIIRSFSILLLFGYVSLVLARFLKIYVYEAVVAYDSDKESVIEIVTQLPPLLVQYMIWVFATPLFTITIVLVYTQIKNRQRLDRAKLERNKAELSFLRAQIHPHFLFNTLNNLYALSIMGSDQTSGTAQKLHDILAYIFHTTKKGTVNISEEIELLKNYIALEQIRYGDRLQVNLDFKVSDYSFTLAPMLLLTLVENAFKHGTSTDADSPYINIEIDQQADALAFKVVNSKVVQKSTDANQYRKGIGLSNLKKQLNLLYVDRYDLQIKEEAQSYSVYLKLEDAFDQNMTNQILTPQYA